MNYEQQARLHLINAIGCYNIGMMHAENSKKYQDNIECAKIKTNYSSNLNYENEFKRSVSQIEMSAQVARHVSETYELLCQKIQIDNYLESYRKVMVQELSNKSTTEIKKLAKSCQCPYHTNTIFTESWQKVCSQICPWHIHSWYQSDVLRKVFPNINNNDFFDWINSSKNLQLLWTYVLKGEIPNSEIDKVK